MRRPLLPAPVFTHSVARRHSPWNAVTFSGCTFTHLLFIPTRHQQVLRKRARIFHDCAARAGVHEAECRHAPRRALSPAGATGRQGEVGKKDFAAGGNLSFVGQLLLIFHSCPTSLRRSQAVCILSDVILSNVPRVGAGARIRAEFVRTRTRPRPSVFEPTSCLALRGEVSRAS